MFGKCPQCNVKLHAAELKNLKKGDAARCFCCGKLYINQPIWVMMKFALMLVLPFVVMPAVKDKVLFFSCAVATFLLVALYNDLKAYLPLIEENKL